MKKNTYFSSCVGWAKGLYFAGRQTLRFLGAEFIPNHKKFLPRKETCNLRLISGWFVQYLAGLWVVWLICGWFVDSLVSLWLVCGWF